ncbi:hypothetical protein ACHQM5_018285 [Ranunculus cassubicifolius]
MECNKDEANRAKEIAEKKFNAKDVPGAKKFALKAQNLFPGLEGLPQMLATLDVYLSAENKIMGEPDLYTILGVNPVADEETVRKQYRKLALMLHPDKNKAVGADGAFKMISEAWGVLSDKTKRNEYDQRRLLKTSQMKGPSTGGGGVPLVPPGTNGFHNFTNNPSSKAGSQRSAARSGSSRQAKPNNTFWTVCHRCKMQYEYLRIYLNHNLLCPNCHEPFYALETAPPPTNGSTSTTPWPSTSQPRQKSTSNKNTGSAGVPGQGHTPSNQTNFQWGPFTKGSGPGSASASAQAQSVVQQAYEKVKRDREEAQAAARRQEAMRKRSQQKRPASNSTSGASRPSKRRNVNEEGSRANFGVNVPADRMGTGNGGMHSATGGFKQSVPFFSKPNSTRELTLHETRNMLAEKARIEIRKKLSEWSMNAAGRDTTDKDKGKEKDKEKQKVPVTRTDSFQSVKKAEADPVDVNPNPNPEAQRKIEIMVPDPDFHDFDRDRSERCFAENQVWAAYDDDDGMPRYYAIIHSVISYSPFKMKISWLNSKTNNELGPMNWVGSGFAKTCGDFRVGKHEINNSLNSFSHKVKWTKGTRGAVRIYPKKGDIWALYRNWSPDWNELTPDDFIHKYDMVEVVDDYNEEEQGGGVFVTPLVKVAGFKTVFHRHLDPREVKHIPREEMFRFSHQVPSYLLTGSEARDAPKGCRELDPAATPLELLQVITEVKEEEMMVDSKPPKEEEVMVDSALPKEDDHIVGSSVDGKKTVGENGEEKVVIKKMKGITPCSEELKSTEAPPTAAVVEDSVK